MTLVEKHHADNNAKYRIGDIIGDKDGLIRVEEVTARCKIGVWHVSYRGHFATKNGQLYKRGGIRVIQESEVTFIKKQSL